MGELFISIHNDVNLRMMQQRRLTMPTAYIKAEFDFLIDLSDDDFKEQFEEWSDKNLEKERAEYGRSNLTFWLQADNPLESISPFAIPVEKEKAYEGSYLANRNNSEFHFLCNAKFKVSVNKNVKEAIDKGIEFKLMNVAINGSSHNIDERCLGNFLISSKKL